LGLEPIFQKGTTSPFNSTFTPDPYTFSSWALFLFKLFVWGLSWTPQIRETGDLSAFLVLLPFHSTIYLFAFMPITCEFFNPICFLYIKIFLYLTSAMLVFFHTPLDNFAIKGYCSTRRFFSIVSFMF